MTACVNNTEKKAKGGVFQSKVLRSAMAAVLAIGLCPTVALAAPENTETSAEAWSKYTVDYTVDANAEGAYVTTVGDIMAVESVTDVFGKTLSASDYDVIYWNDVNENGKFDNGDTIVDDDDAIDHKFGGAPDAEGKYIVTVADRAWMEDNNYTPGEGWGWSSVWDAAPVKSQGFTVTLETISLDGSDAFAYEVGKDAEDVSDTAFKFTGANLNVGFAVDGEPLVAGEYTAAYVQGESPVKDAGTYSVILKGTGVDKNNDGTVVTGAVTVSFKVDPIDLSSDTITVAPTKSLEFSNTTPTATLATDQLLVNEEALVNGLTDLTAELEAKDGSPKTEITGKNPVTDPAAYTFLVSDVDPDNGNVIGGPVTLDVNVVNEMVDYTYKGVVEADGETINIDPTYGDSFNAAYIGALYDTDKAAEFDVAIADANGNAVEAISEPGTYTVTLTTDVFSAAGKTYVGYAKWTVVVKGKEYKDPAAYVSVDGKIVSGSEPVEYTGDPVEYVVVVKDGAKTLVEGEDYTVELTKGGEAVESAVEPGKYTVTITLADQAETEFAVEIESAKAEIESAKATAEFFALPADGSAAAPTFTGYTQANCKGQAFDLAADQISVEYYPLTWNEDAANADGTKGAWEVGKAIDASELTEEGTYRAKINVLTTAPYIQGTGIEADFVLAERVAFSDVDSNAWYADPVFQAAENGYVNDIGGTDLFMPNADIDRAQIAAIMFNMAGGQGDGSAITPYPTRFSDVDPNGWYAKACGNDVAVDDVDGALAEFGDGAQVSDWARAEVAWAVENGVMGNGGYLAPQDQITRAEVAAMAVNYQPAKL